MHKKAIITWGRMNPPHIGHRDLISKVIQKGNNIGADAFVVVTHTQNKRKNPLTQNEKASIIRTMFPNNKKLGILKTSKKISNPSAMARFLKSKGYDEVFFIVGSNYDHTEEKSYGYNWVEGVTPVIPGVPRGTTGMSATAVRGFALAGNRESMCRAMNNRVNVNACMQLIRNRLAPQKRKTPTKNNKNPTKKTRTSPKNNSPPRTRNSPSPPKNNSPPRTRNSPSPPKNNSPPRTRNSPSPPKSVRSSSRLRNKSANRK